MDRNYSRDLTDAQWQILETFIPQSTPRRDRRGAHGRIGAQSWTAFCGCCGQVLLGRMFLNAIRLPTACMAASTRLTALKENSATTSKSPVRSFAIQAPPWKFGWVI